MKTHISAASVTMTMMEIYEPLPFLDWKMLFGDCHKDRKRVRGD